MMRRLGSRWVVSDKEETRKRRNLKIEERVEGMVMEFCLSMEEEKADELVCTGCVAVMDC